LISDLNTGERKGDDSETITGDEVSGDSSGNEIMNKKQFQHLDIFPMEDHRAEFRELVRAAAGARIAGKLNRTTLKPASAMPSKISYHVSTGISSRTC
jgi:hypothetical protein